MDLRFRCYSLTLCLLLALISGGVSGPTFTFVNKCDYTIWPGILANAGTPVLDTTGFELPKATQRLLQAPAGWSGRFWGRTGCDFDGSGSGSGRCATADCGSGEVACSGNGAATPATLAEFTLGSDGSGQDFYDVSLVDGFNLPMMVEPSGGSGACAPTGCVTDLSRQCPAELRPGDGGGGCMSACGAFATPEYCCSGEYGSPATCKPSVYSTMFKAACPTSYSYAYDDTTSTFTCTGADYTITFCPSKLSQKSTNDPTPPPPPPPAAAASTTSTRSQSNDSTPRTLYPAGQTLIGFSESGGESNGDSASESGFGSSSDSGSSGTWLAGLAMGDSARASLPCGLRSAAIATASSFSLFLYLLCL